MFLRIFMLKTEVFPHTQVGLDHYRAVLSHVLFQRKTTVGVNGRALTSRALFAESKRGSCLNSSGSMREVDFPPAKSHLTLFFLT